MTPQESAMLNDLVRKVQQTQLTEKDPEAESLLGQTLGRDPDAIYILAQTVLVQNIALDQARAQIEQLKQQQPQPAHTTSFLGSLLGHREQPASAPPPPPAYSVAPPPYAEPYPGLAPAASGAGGFLRSAATTAAGVAAGALAFEGVESMLHGFGHSGGMGYGGYGMGGGMPVEENVVNNYYDTPPPGVEEHHEHEASFDDRPDPGSGSQPSLDGASYNPSGDASDNSDVDDSGFNDDGSDFGGDDSNFA